MRFFRLGKGMFGIATLALAGPMVLITDKGEKMPRNLMQLGQDGPMPICDGGFKLPRMYQHGMVFQAAPDKAPLVPTIGPNFYGFSDDDPKYCPITLTTACNSIVREVTTVSQAENITRDGSYLWSTTLPPGQNGEWCVVTVKRNQLMVNLWFVYGDVWICSGQSNMVYNLQMVLNGTEEMDLGAREYRNIKMFRLFYNENATNEYKEDIYEKPGYFLDWHNTGKHIGLIAAPCYLFAKKISDEMSKLAPPGIRNNRVIGLIEAAVTGVRIETFMSKEAVSRCHSRRDDVEATYNYAEAPRFLPEHAWKWMLWPLTRHSIYGFLFYQGESNVLVHMEDYPCLFNQLIKSWRSTWQERSTNAAGHSGETPFGFVQLGIFPKKEKASIMRWHQTGGLGYAPNHLQPNVFMAVSLDSHETDEVHPKNKQLVCQRLAYAAMNVAYGNKEYPTRGPFPVKAKMEGDGNVVIKFDQPFTYHNEVYWDPSCWSYCETFTGCELDVTQWVLLDQKMITPNEQEQTVTVDMSNTVLYQVGKKFQIAYLWRDNCITKNNSTVKMPMYGHGPWFLPVPPFKTDNLGAS